MTDHDAIAARARDHIARGGSPYIAPSEYLDLCDEVTRLRDRVLELNRETLKGNEE